MIKTKIIIKFVLPLVIFFLASCEGNTNREWRVNNNSSTTIVVRAGIFSSDTLYLSIEPQVEKIITITSEEKGNSEPQQAYDVFSHFLVTNADGETTDMDYVDNDNWDIYIEESKRSPPHFEHTYTLVVTNADFE